MTLELDAGAADSGLAASLERAAAILLEELQATDQAPADGVLSVSLVDDRHMRELNSRWRDLDRSTDVLSFAQEEATREDGSQDDTVAAPPAAATGAERPLGDVVISLDTALRQAEEGGWTATEEVTRLLLHGLLHLLGYDHEGAAPEAERMLTEERRLAALLRSGGCPCAGDSR
jgi:probable rRNA maturation factor